MARYSGSWARVLSETSKLPDLLLESCLRRAKHPKDHIYGLLGLLGPYLREGIRISFEGLTDAEVFTDAMKAVLRDPEGQSHWILLLEAYRSVAGNTAGLPSWCVDFSKPPLSVTDAGFHGWLTVSAAVREKYDHRSDSRVQGEANVLSLTALVLDRVEIASPVAARCPRFLRPDQGKETTRRLNVPQESARMQREAFEDSFGAHAHSWLQTMHELFSSAADGQDGPLAWLENFADPQSDEQGLIRQAFSNTPQIALLCKTALRTGVGSNDSLAAIFSLEVKDLDAVQRMVQVLFYRHHERYYFRTESGKMGFAPQPVQAGDILCYIPGGQYLHVISKDEDQYASFAFVDGLMQDGLLELADEDQAWETFSLR